MKIREQWELKWKDYYEILGLDSCASIEEIKMVCLEKEQILHPDNFIGKPERIRRRAEREFIRVVEAREVLMSPERRSRYDSQWQSINRPAPSEAPQNGHHLLPTPIIRALLPPKSSPPAVPTAAPAATTIQPNFILWVSAYLVWICLAEALFVFFSARIGMVAHTLLLAALIGHSAQVQHRELSHMLLSLALVPLIRVASLALPLAAYPQVYWYLLAAVPVLAATWVAMQTIGLRFADVGFTIRNLPVQLLVGCTGLALGMLEYQILRPDPLAGSLALKAVLGPAIILLISTGFTEEFVFRGVLQRTFRQALGNWGIIYAAVIFAVLHLGYLSALDMVFVFAVALLFAGVVLRTGSILGVTLAHGLTNISLFLIFPFLLN